MLTFYVQFITEQLCGWAAVASVKQTISSLSLKLIPSGHCTRAKMYARILSPPLLKVNVDLLTEKNSLICHR